MTVLDVLKIALRRSSLDDSLTEYQTNARSYLNDVIKQIESDATWWWKFKSGSFITTKTMTITGYEGAFTVGETITGANSGATATVAGDDTGTLRVYSESTTEFTASETINGGTSGEEAIYQSITPTRLYSLDVGIMNLLSVFNNTGDNKLSIAYPQSMQNLDPDFSITGTPEFLYIHGLDSITGAPRIGLYPKDDTTNETIDYQYYSFTPAFTAENDATSLDPYVLPFIQAALYHGIAKLLQQEKGDEEGMAVEMREFDRIMQRARRQNLDMMGDKRFRRMRQTRTGQAGVSTTVVEGTL